jgi:hypothetical protein
MNQAGPNGSPIVVGRQGTVAAVATRRDYGDGRTRISTIGVEHGWLGAYPPKMTFGSSLLLIAVGAILRYAVTATVSGIDLNVVGLVLMIVGIVGLVISLLWFGVWAGRRREVPPVEREVRDRNIY